MTDKIRQTAEECVAKLTQNCDGIELADANEVEDVTQFIERAMRELLAAQPAATRHVPTLTFGAGEFSCAVCGLGMEKPCEHWKPTPASEEELVKCITGYLASGGLFNPEMAIHDRVRDLLIDCRHALEIRAERVKEAVEAEREACAKIADEDFTLDEHTPCDEGHREFYKKYGTAEVCEAIRARGTEAKR